MVCFGLSWRRLLPVALACLLPLCGCNYHGRLKRGIYNTPSFDDKIEARVMVVADRFIQPYFSFKDDNLTPVNSYQIRTRDGASVAAADALGTLFSEVEVNLYKYRSQYDYAAELDYNVTEESDYFTRLEPADGFLWLKKYRVPKFHTSVTLTLRDTKTELPVLQFAADRTTELEFNNTAIGLYWFNRATLSLLFPLIAPVYTSSAGNSIRTTLERAFPQRRPLPPFIGKNGFYFTSFVARLRLLYQSGRLPAYQCPCGKGRPRRALLSVRGFAL